MGERDGTFKTQDITCLIPVFCFFQCITLHITMKLPLLLYIIIYYYLYYYHIHIIYNCMGVSEGVPPDALVKDQFS
jgi:hypothetical protein